MAYEITAHRDGYRRAGMAHRSTPTVHPSDAFTKEQLAQLEADPRIMIREVPDTALEGPDKAAAVKVDSETLRMVNTHDAQELLNTTQAAAIAQVHPTSVRMWVRDGSLTAVQVKPIRIDPATLEVFLRERARPKKPPVPDFDLFDEVDTETDLTAHVMADDAEHERVEMPPMPSIESPKDELWQALVLTLQRQLTAAETREAQLLNLLDHATKPKPRIPRRLKVGDMPLLYRVLNYIESIGRPVRAWQVKEGLGLDQAPYRDLSRLVAKRRIRRLREGVYAAMNHPSG
jgi:hypothetical protein